MDHNESAWARRKKEVAAEAKERRIREGNAWRSDDPRYPAWRSMRARCNYPWHEQWENYGGRGITYDPSWESFDKFAEDMGEKPEGMWLERKDNDGPYCKDNCTWATPSEQRINQRFQTKARADSQLGIRGVYFVKAKGKYLARASPDEGRKTLYYGDSLEEATKARKDWEIQKQRSMKGD